MKSALDAMPLFLLDDLLMLTNSTRQSLDKCHTYDSTQPLHAQGCYNFDFNNTNFLNETNGTAVQKVPLNLLKWFYYSVFPPQLPVDLDFLFSECCKSWQS